MKKKTVEKVVFGEYNRYGYTIIFNDTELLAVGNHKQDSYPIVSLDSPSCLSLMKIRNYCIKTGREIAKEKKAKWIGADRIEELILEKEI